MYLQLFRKITYLIIFYLPSFALTGQSQYSYSFNRYDASLGLITDYNTFFLTDSRGFVWISSTNGLNRFDGQRVKIYKHIANDSTSLADDNIQSPFFEDKYGNIWFCTYEAIHCYKRSEDKFERIWIEQDGQKVTNSYYAFNLDTEGYLWLRVGSWNSNPKLCKLNTEKNKEGKYDYSFVSEFCGYRSLTAHQNGIKEYSILTFPSKTGLGFVEYKMKQAGKIVDSLNYFTGSPTDKINKSFKIKQILEDNDKSLWIATTIGLVHFDKNNNSYNLFDSFQKLKLQNILSIVEWRKDYLIVSVEKEGLLFFNKKTNAFYYQIKQDNNISESNGLGSNSFDNLYIDATENLWLFSWKNSCINHINLKKIRFRTIKLEENLFDSDYRKIMEDADGNLWVSNASGTIFIFDTNKKLVKTIIEPLWQGKKIDDLIRDKKNRIWIKTEHKLFIYDRNIKKIKTVFDFGKVSIQSILALQNGRLLMGTSAGIFEINDADNVFKYSKIEFQDKTNQSNPNGEIFQDSKNNLYLTTHNQKILAVNLNNKEWIIKKEIPFVDAVSATYEQKDTIWLGGIKGVWKMYPSGEDSFQIDHILKLNFVWTLDMDNNNNLWILTDSDGLYSFNPLTGKQKKYTTSDGIKSKFLSRGIFASTGDMWLIGRNSLIAFRPEEIVDYENPPKVQITGIKVNNNDYVKQGEVSELKKIKLNYTENNIELEFTAIEFGNSSSNRVKYRLDNLDEAGSWIETYNVKPAITYYKLPPGVYTFRIKGFNSDGFESQQDKTLIIEITPPWYKTWWAFILEIIAGLLGIYGFVKWRLYVQNQRAEMQQKILKTEMKALRAQMDPHFLFNTMNSINAYILKNDRMQASHFLTDFAILIRKILDFSKEETISIEQEEEILRGYLQMEAMRFDNNFDYDIIIDDDIDPWDTQVPTMILQPFIENAILHGIRNKTNGRGKIIIRFEPDGKEYYKCILEDNGVGRKKAAEINAQSRSKSHVSKGMSITNDRIDVLNHQRAQKTSLLIEDLYTDDNQPAGTRVNIRIPYYEK